MWDKFNTKSKHRVVYIVKCKYLNNVDTLAIIGISYAACWPALVAVLCLSSRSCWNMLPHRPLAISRDRPATMHPLLPCLSPLQASVARATSELGCRACTSTGVSRTALIAASKLKACTMLISFSRSYMNYTWIHHKINILPA